MSKLLFIEQTATERVEILFRKSRKQWLTQEELGELIKIRDAKEDIFASNFAAKIIQTNKEKLNGTKHW